jgi:hypothetical protein
VDFSIPERQKNKIVTKQGFIKSLLKIKGKKLKSFDTHAMYDIQRCFMERTNAVKLLKRGFELGQ